MKKLMLFLALFFSVALVSNASALTLTSLEIRGYSVGLDVPVVWNTLGNEHWILGVSRSPNPLTSGDFENAGNYPASINFEFNPGESIYLFSETGRFYNGYSYDLFSGTENFTLFVNGIGYTQFNILWGDESNPTDFTFTATQSGPFTLEFLGFGYDEVSDLSLTPNGNGSNDAAYRLTYNVPEPTTVLLLGIGLIGLAGLSRKKFFKK